MTGFYVYGIADRPLRPRGRGVFDHPVRTVPVGSLYVVAESARQAPKPTLARLRKQNRVVAGLVTSGATILPARFGAFAATRSELERMIGTRAVELRRALRRVRGCVQMTVRVPIASDPAAGPHRARPAGGAAFLRARAAEGKRRSRDPLLRAVAKAAKPFARDTRLEWPAAGAGDAVVHHLVPHHSLQRYVDALTQLGWGRGEALPGIRSKPVDPLPVSGPWAPFAFVEIS